MASVATNSHFGVRDYVDALNRATQDLPVGRKNEIFSAAAGLFSVLSARSGTHGQSPVDLVQVASVLSDNEGSDRFTGGNGSSIPLSSGNDLSQNNGSGYGGLPSSGIVPKFSSVLPENDGDFVGIDEVLQTRIASYSGRRVDADGDSTDEDVEVVKERIRDVSGLNLAVPKFEFLHSNSEYISGLSDDESTLLDTACGDFVQGCEMEQTGIKDACAQMTKYQIRKKRKKDRLAMFGPYETSFDDVVKCHFYHEGKSYCAAFRQHGNVYMSTEFRRIVLDYNLCADSVSKIMSISAAKSCRSSRVDSISWAHFSGAKNYPFQLEKGYYTYFSKEKKALLEAYVAYFYQIAAVNDRLIFNKTKKGFLNKYKPMIPGSNLLVHSSYEGVGVMSWARDRGKNTVIGRSIFKNDLFPYETPQSSVDVMTVSNRVVKCPYANCNENSWSFRDMVSHVNNFHLST